MKHETMDICVTKNKTNIEMRKIMTYGVFTPHPAWHHGKIFTCYLACDWSMCYFACSMFNTSNHGLDIT